MRKTPLSPKSPKYPRYNTPTKSIQAAQRSGPISPRLKVPETTIPQTKKDSISQTFFSLAGQNLRILPPQARNPGIIALNLEDNQFTLQTVSEFPKNITSLSLRNNPIQSCKFPKFDRLRSLLLDNCGLTSFEGLPSFPNLRLFSVSGNQISSLKALPIFNHLESFNISNNAFDFNVVTCIAAIGSISLNKFNGVQVTAEDIRAAFSLSPLVGYSLRKGRTPERFETPEEELEETQKFLTAPLIKHFEQTQADVNLATLEVKEVDDQPSVVLPFVAENVKWYRDILPDQQGKEWASLTLFTNKEMINILPLTNIMKMHIIRCDFTLNGKQFSLYTSQPIGRIESDLCLPFPLDPVLAGFPMEGSLISLIPLPIPTHVAWVSGANLVVENVPSIILTNKEVGKPMTCLLAPYCPNYQEIIFTTLMTETENVGPLLPTVSGIQFPENIVEGVEMTFTRKMIPDREGQSIVILDKARTQSSPWEQICQLETGDLRYTPTTEDVGHFLRIQYTPITQEGTQGETVIFYSKTKVLPTLPRFENCVIAGYPRVGATLVACGEYTGGKKGKCEYTWFVSDEPLDPNPRFRRGLKPSCTKQILLLTEEHIGKFIGVDLIPIRDDEVIGESSFVALDCPISDQSEDKKTQIEYNEKIYAGKKITLEDQVQFFIAKVGADNGFEPVKFGNSWVPKKEHVGHWVKAETPDSEGLLGEVLPSASYIKEVSLTFDKAAVDQEIGLRIKTYHMSPTDLEVIWAKVQGPVERAIAYNSNTYTPQQSDVGYQIKAIVTPFDKNGNRLPPSETDLTPVVKARPKSAPTIVGKCTEGSVLSVQSNDPIEEIEWQHNNKGAWKTIGNSETYTLTKQDIGRNIRAICKIEGKKIITTALSAVGTAGPTATVSLPDDETPVEGTSYQLNVQYQGGSEGVPRSQWYRKEVTQDGEENFVLVAENTKEYTPKKEDVGHELKITYVPRRTDKVEGKEVVLETPQVAPALPCVKNVKLIQNNDGYLELKRDYIGGEEGDSVLLWHTFNDEGTDTPFAKTKDLIIIPHPDLFGRQAYVEYYPMRSDQTRGPKVKSNTITIEPRPHITQAEVIAKGGVIKPGNLLRLKYQTALPTPKATFQWYRCPSDDFETWIPIEGATDIEYTPTDDDGDFVIGCQVIAIDKKGWKSDPVATNSQIPVQSASTKVKIIIPEIEEKKDKTVKAKEMKEKPKERLVTTGMVLSLLVTKQNVETDDYSIIWQRDNLETGRWEDMSYDRTYHTTANDIGHKLRAYCPDDKTDKNAFCVTNVITLPEKAESLLKAVIRSKSLRLKCSSKTGGSNWTVFITKDGIQMRSKTGNEKSAKWPTISAEAIEGTTDQMKLVTDVSSSFLFIPKIDDLRLESSIGKENVRDFVVAVISIFASM